MRIRRRWTILNVKEKVISIVIRHSKDNGFTAARALEDLIVKGKRVKDEEDRVK